MFCFTDRKLFFSLCHKTLYYHQWTHGGKKYSHCVVEETRSLITVCNSFSKCFQFPILRLLFILSRVESNWNHTGHIFGPVWLRMKSPDEDQLESVSSVIIHSSHISLLIVQLLGRQTSRRTPTRQKQGSTTE